MANLRMVFGTGDVIIRGYISKDGYTKSNEIIVTIKLGSPTSNIASINNDWMIVEKTEEERTAQVTVKKDQGSVTLGDITNSNGGTFNFAQVVAAIAIGNSDYTGGVTPADALQDQIVSAIGDQLFDSITLSQLVGKTITFNGFTVKFVQQQ